MYMQLEKQVVSLELAKKLKELGVKQESLFWWLYDEDGDYVDYLYGETLPARGLKEPFLRCSAYTVAELGELLPPGFISGQVEESEGYVCFDENNCNVLKDGFVGKYEDTEADARAKMLIYLLSNDLFKSQE